MAATLVPIGRIVNVHAIHGELRLLPFNPQSTVLGAGVEVVLRRDGRDHTYEISGLRPHKRFLLIRLRGCDSMQAAEHLVGTELLVDAALLPPAKEDEIYHYELIGMRVESEDGTLIGEVCEVMPLPSADVCVVHDSAGKEHLIPLAASIVKHIDRHRRCLVIHPLPGLLE